jgi:hypothetical protein
MSNAGKARMSIGRMATNHHFEMFLPKICIEEVYSRGKCDCANPDFAGISGLLPDCRSTAQRWHYESLKKRTAERTEHRLVLLISMGFRGVVFG